ncbi:MULTISPECIES: ABC transporter permease [unclassified Crossiella]|uniref:ABC transporter permease n=1 Tax=unclassified Crossiella TaxID=2620835 RepID=UPI002000590E|nr:MULTISPECIES: ABC transporter permease subunit [unclassified Crossiella]MCK2237449.1 ABC transporter permease subunit [Crossiella sp. S99.2]MCK2251104.1 ABC transporter permease subunit [Crossiella sp. S99.1]
MTWIVWRQQRLALISLAVALFAGVVAVLLLRAGMTADLDARGIAGCVLDGIKPGSACSGTAVTEFQDTWFDRMKIAQSLVLALPALVGVFIGAPLFAREFEQGTHVLAFTQSVSRIRWMASKFLVTAVPALVVLLTLQFLVGGWLAAAGSLGPLKTGPFAATTFGASGISPFAYTLFAYTLGMFLGALSRRTLMAMTLTLGVFVVIRYVLTGLQQFMLTPKRITSDDPTSSAVPTGDRSLVLDSGHLDAAGNVLPNSWSRISGCGARGNEAMPTDQLTCYREHGLVKSFADLIPADAATSLHLVEGSIFLGLAVLFTLGSIWAVRRQV